MHPLSSLGPLTAAAWRPGHRVQVATGLAVGDIVIPALEDPSLLLVPANVASLQQMWDALRMPSRNNLLITGESGTGKTTLIRYLGEVYRQVALVRAREAGDSRTAAHDIARAASFQTRILTFHENLRRSDITERRHYGETGEDKTGWTMSDVMDGMVAGDWNVLSEINRTGEDVQAEFNEPLENKAKSLHQRVIRGHPDSRFIATTNPVKSAGRGIYEGKVMSGEFVNRFTNKVHLSYLPPDQEFEVLKSYGPCVDDQIIDRLIAIAGDIRRDYAEEHGVVPFPVTTRALIRMVRHLGRFPADSSLLRSLFWRKAYWLDDRIHPPIARKLVSDLLDLHDITGQEVVRRERSHLIRERSGERPSLAIGSAVHPIGPGGPYVPDTVIEEVPQNLADLEWILKDIVLGENILLIGEAGVGKNKLESYLAHLLNTNLLVIGMSGETRVSDLLTYRSFGEDEAGKTGDTATLGLQALTDPDHDWIIVLDEANKAHPGVLVSFNDLLQDRRVRLPGGTEAPIRATICVNINPNRPPYEVNDFSFEFMDRFSIHTIVHLPADQAVAVLRAKYPEADPDFVQDVVRGYYALHPLYSSGILFEPVTMRNEEAAIERGLQYPGRACNLIDLLSTCYGPRDGRELHAIQGTLQAAGFDRSVLAAARALDQYRASWEEDRGNEEKAITLVRTYQAIGKPLAAQKVLAELRSQNPGREWVSHLLCAGILIDDGKAGEAEAELRRGFLPGSVLAMDNGEEYVVIHADLRRSTLELSLEARNSRTGSPALIMGLPENPAPSLHRLNGEYSRTFSDPAHGLVVYERVLPDPWSPPQTETPDPSESPPGHPAPGSPASREPLSSLVRESVLLGGSGPGFHRQICRLPDPPWTPPMYTGGDVVRELTDTMTSMRIAVHTDGGWTITVSDQEEGAAGAGAGTIGWRPETGDFFCTGKDGGMLRVPSPGDPVLGLTYHASSKTLFLILPDDLARVACSGERHQDSSPGVCILSPGIYHAAVLSPLNEKVVPRLHDIFRYSRPLSRYPFPGSGDIIYTIQPGSAIVTALLVDIDGFGPSYSNLSPPREGPAGPPAITGERMILPFRFLDSAEAWLAQALSPDTQHYLQDLRRYIASAFLVATRPRDHAFEQKALSILAEYREIAVPVEHGTELHAGDILVRNADGDHMPPFSRSVFIVRFLQGGRSTRDGTPIVVRGFWLGEPTPVATEDLASIPGQFGRVLVEGDDRYDRIVRQLVAGCHESGRPWEYSRTGSLHDSVVQMQINGVSLKYRPVERHFSIMVGGGEAGGSLVIEETGYPVEMTVVNAGDQEVLRWHGLPLADIRCHRGQGALLIVLEDDFLSAVKNCRVIPDGADCIFLARSEAAGDGIPGSGPGT